MPGLHAKMLLVLALWLKVCNSLAFSLTVKPQLSMPIARAVAKQSSLLTLACKSNNQRKSGSKASDSTSRSPMGFAAAAKTSASRRTTPRQPLATPRQEGTNTVSVDVAGYNAEEDGLTLLQLGRLFADMRANYSSTATNTTTQQQEFARRSLQRLEDLPLNRCSAAPSSIIGAGNGLFARRDIAEGELITCYPGDAVFEWDHADHASTTNMQVYLSKQSASSEANALRFVHELRGYEVPASATLSVLGDPLRCADAAYLGHMANDCARPAFSDREVASNGVLLQDQDEKDGYYAASNACVNAEHISLGACHVLTRALRAIAAGEEVFVSYGYGYWLASRQKDQEAHAAGAKPVTNPRFL